MNYPFDQVIEDRPWSRSVRKMFDVLRERFEDFVTQEPGFLLSPDMVLLGILQFGQQQRNNPRYLAGHLSSIANRTDAELGDLFGKECMNVLREGNRNPSIRDFEQEIKSLFKSAEDVASKVGREEQISMRHLIAALLLPAHEKGRVGERCTLFQKVLPAAEFAAALVQHVNTSKHVEESDQLDKWRSILRRIQTRTPPDKEHDSKRDVVERIDEAINSGTNLSRSVDPASDEITFVDLATLYSFEPAVIEILNWAQKEVSTFHSKEFLGQITPRALFYSAVLYGSLEPGFHPDADCLESLVQLTPERLREIISKELTPKTPSQLKEASARFTPQMREVGQIAMQLAKETTGTDTIALRHLLSAILTFKNPLEYLHFTRLDIESKRVIYGFLKYLRDKYPSDNPVAWTNAFADTARLDGIRLSPAGDQLSGTRANASEDSNQRDGGASRSSDIELQALPSGKEAKGDSFDFTFLELCERRFAELRGKWKFSTSILSVLDELRIRLSKAWLEECDQQVSPAAMGLAVFIRAADDSAWPEDLFKSIRAKTPAGRDHLISLLAEELKRNQSQTPAAPKVFSDSLILILDDAKRMAETISSDKILGVRHVLCALFRHEAAVLALLRSGLPVGAFITSLREHIADGTMVQGVDHRELWSPELKKIAEVLTAAESMRANDDRGQSRTGPLKFGAEDSFIREASITQSCLKVEVYAGALRDFFSKAGPGELCFALYGHWGRGKTYLMKMVRDALVEKKYETVFFSAWKYPGTPEVWVSLYETMVDHATDGNLLKVVPRNIRSGVSKNGPWPLIVALALFVFGLVPKIDFAEHLIVWAEAVGGILGLGGLIWVVEFMCGLRKTAKRLSHDYLSARHHTEKLGLQATIGKDLESMLAGWMPQGKFKFGWATIAYFAIVTVFAWSAWHWFGFLSGLADFLGRHPVLHYFFDLKSHPELKLGFSIAAAAFGVGLFVWVFGSFSSPKRVLLVIDDLDRCKPEQLLSIVESIKLLLEDTEISKRVQVAMLVEEDILRQAVHKKYVVELGLICIEKFDKKRIVDENLEKLFTTHLRLPPLSEEDFREVFRKILDLEEEAYQEIVKKIEDAKKTQPTQNAASSPKTVQTAPPPPNSDPAKASQAALSAFDAPSSVPGAPALQQPEPGVKPAEPLSSEAAESTWESGFVFSSEEKLAFIEIIPLLRELNLPWGPRSIRAFTFRYQLARLILRRLGLKMPTPKDLLTELAKAIKRDRAEDKYELEILKVIHQVS